MDPSTNTTQRWVFGNSVEARILNPEGTEHPVISKDKDGKFWFWDETWMDMYGPFGTIDDCKDEMAEYGQSLTEDPKRWEGPTI